MRTKTKALSLLLALVMVFSLLPVQAMADEAGSKALVSVEDADGSNYYEFETLAEAVAAVADGGTVKLLQDFTTGGRIDVSDKSITLDLNGKTVTSTIGNAFVYVHGASGGKVTITDSSENDAGKISGQDCVLWIQGGTVELLDGTVECAGYWEYGGSYWGNSAVEIKGSTTDEAGYSSFIMGEDAVITSVTATADGDPVGTGYVMIDNNSNCAYGASMDIRGTIEHALLYVNGNIKQTSGNVPVINVYDTAVVNGGIYAAGYAEWNITGGTISGATGIEIRAGVLNVSGDAVISGHGSHTS